MTGKGAEVEEEIHLRNSRNRKVEDFKMSQVSRSVFGLGLSVCLVDGLESISFQLGGPQAVPF